MISTEVTEDNASDISEEIDELAGDLEAINNEIPNNGKRVSFNGDNNSNDEKKRQDDDEENDNIYEIEKIVDHRTYRGSIQYMIKWKGYPDKHNSWVSKEHVYAEQKESEYWNNKEIEAKEKIKSLADKHDINTSRSLKKQKSNRIKKNKDKHISKKSFVELKTTNTKDKLNSNNDNNKDISVSRNSDINNNSNVPLANYYTTPLQSSENSESGEENNNNSDNEGQYENEEMLKYDYNDDEYDNFTPAAIAGSWEPYVKDVATIQQDPCTGTLIVFLNWKNGHRTSHTNKVTNVKCPQKMLEFYQKHVQFVATNHQQY